MDDLNTQNQSTDRTSHALALLLAALLAAALVIFLITSAVQAGSIWIIVGLLAGGVLLAVFVLDRLSIVHHRFIEARSIQNANQYERSRDGSFRVSFDRPALVQLPTVRRESYTPITDQVKSPDALTDPRRELGVRLLAATNQHPDYGPRSTKIMTQTDAQKTGLFPGAGTHDQALAYLKDYYDIETFTKNGRDNGSFCKDGKTVSQVLLDTAIHALPIRPPKIG